MINGMTVEEYNAREKRRASIVSRLHGYVPWEPGDTEEGLEAAYSELTGESYRSQEEEQADNVQQAKEQRQLRIAAQLKEEQDAIRAAKANDGFMDCREIRDALGWSKPKANGSYYSMTGVAYRWIRDAGEEIVYVLQEDGRRITSLAFRSGCWESAFLHILDVKEQWDADRAVREKKSWDDAQQAKDDFNRDKAEELAALIAQQDADRAVRAAERTARYAQINAARDLAIQMLMAEAEAEAEDEQVIPEERRASIIEALRSYTGPLTKNGLPKRKALNAWAGFEIEGWEKRECWEEAQND